MPRRPSRVRFWTNCPSGKGESGSPLLHSTRSRARDGPYPTIERPEDVPETLWLTQPLTAMGFGLYSGDPVPDDAVPHRCDLSGLPPTLVTTAEYDALSDQARRFVELACAAGVEVTHHHEPTFLHGYLNMVSQLATADGALSRHVAWLRAALRTER